MRRKASPRVCAAAGHTSYRAGRRLRAGPIGLHLTNGARIGRVDLIELGLVHHRDLGPAPPAVEEFHRVVSGEPPNESRLSCGALKKDSFRNLRAPAASSACYAAGAPNLTPTGPVLHRGHAKPSRIPRTPP